MNDGDLDPPHQLASAYLDDDITSAERVRVEASPELVSLVESFRQIRAGLCDVPAPSATTREAAFAAALLEFDGLSSPGDAASMGSDSAAPPVVSLAERRRWPIAVLSVAAAVLLVGVVGIAALSGRDDDKRSSATDAASQQMASSAGEAADIPAPMSTIGSITGAGAQVSMQIDTPEQLLALQAPSDVATDLSPEATAATEAAAADSTVTDQGDSKRAASNFSSSPAISCLAPQQIFLADIQYRGVFGIAARDTVTGVTQAIADDCTVLVSVGP